MENLKKEICILKNENTALQHQIVVMQQLATAAGFREYYFKQLKNFATKIEAFNYVNNLYYSYFGEYRYSYYESFRRVNYRNINEK